MTLTEQVEVAAQAVHDAVCKDRGEPYRECPRDVLGVAVDVVLALRDTGDLSRADDE